jgi:hypothetical protein
MLAAAKLVAELPRLLDLDDNPPPSAESPQGQRVGKVFPLVDLATGKPLAARRAWWSCRLKSWSRKMAGR